MADHDTHDHSGVPGVGTGSTAWQSGSPLSFSGAASGTGVSASTVDDKLVIAFTNGSYQYHDIASAIGTGDFDIRARILGVESTGATNNTPLFGLYLTDGSRTQSTAFGVSLEGPSPSVFTTATGRGGSFADNDTSALGRGFPVVLRVKRVGTTVTLYSSVTDGISWSQHGSTISSSLSIGKVGFTMHVNSSTSGAAVIDAVYA